LLPTTVDVVVVVVIAAASATVPFTAVLVGWAPTQQLQSLLTGALVVVIHCVQEKEYTTHNIR